MSEKVERIEHAFCYEHLGEFLRLTLSRLDMVKQVHGLHRQKSCEKSARKKSKMVVAWLYYNGMGEWVAEKCPFGDKITQVVGKEGFPHGLVEESDFDPLPTSKPTAQATEEGGA